VASATTIELRIKLIAKKGEDKPQSMAIRIVRAVTVAV